MHNAPSLAEVLTPAKLVLKLKSSLLIVGGSCDDEVLTTASSVFKPDLRPCRVHHLGTFQKFS